MQYKVKVPVALFIGCSGKLYYQSCERFSITSGEFVGYSYAPKLQYVTGEVWIIDCTEQTLTWLMLAHNIKLAECELGVANVAQD